MSVRIIFLVIIFALANPAAGVQQTENSSSAAKSDALKSVKDEGPFEEMLKRVSPEKIAAIKVRIRDTRVDMTSEKERILSLLLTAKRSNQNWIGLTPPGNLSLTTTDGVKIEIDLHETYFVSHMGDKVQIYHSDLVYFCSALRYDSKNRVLTETEFRDLLLKYAESSAGNIDAFCELGGSFKDTRIIPLVPKYVGREALFAIARFENVDDPAAIDAVVKQFKKEQDWWVVADTLKQWGHVEKLKHWGRDPKNKDLAGIVNDRAGFAAFLCDWFENYGMYADALKTIRSIELNKIETDKLRCFFELLSNEDRGSRPKPTDEEKREIVLLMADIVEHRFNELPYNFYHSLWAALQMNYDPASQKLVALKDLHFFIREGADAKKAAEELRKWANEQFKK